MDAVAGRQVLVVFDPVMQEVSEGMLWILVSGNLHFLSLPEGIPQRQPHRRPGLATLPSAEAVP